MVWVRVVSCQSRPGVRSSCGRGGRRSGGGIPDEGFVVSRQVVQGPGSLRVGRFIGRLGVVSLPAVEVGLDRDQRVVRRHVAKLEAAGWLARAPWVWGEGSVTWLTGAGVEGAGLGGVRAVKSPPAPTTIEHGVLVGWSAARAEHRSRVWKSARELALDRERWAVLTRCERGYTDAAARPGGLCRPGFSYHRPMWSAAATVRSRRRLSGARTGLLSRTWARYLAAAPARLSRSAGALPRPEGPGGRLGCGGAA